MASSVDFPGSNKELVAPSGEEDRVGSLRVFCNQVSCTSCWELSDEEIAEIIKTKRVYLSIFSGLTQPPVFVGGKREVLSVLADFGGVWKEP